MEWRCKQETGERGQERWKGRWDEKEVNKKEETTRLIEREIKRWRKCAEWKEKRTWKYLLGYRVIVKKVIN